MTDSFHSRKNQTMMQVFLPGSATSVPIPMHNVHNSRAIINTDPGHVHVFFRLPKQRGRRTPPVWRRWNGRSPPDPLLPGLQKRRNGHVVRTPGTKLDTGCSDWEGETQIPDETRFFLPACKCFCVVLWRASLIAWGCWRLTALAFWLHPLFPGGF